jgi:Saxitoxin biosynthesis operon protein SxtJ
MSVRLTRALTMHEDFSRSAGVKLSSDRTFGLVWTVFLVLYGLAPLRHAGRVRIWLIVLAGMLLLISVIFSRVLHRPNLWWARVGLLLSRVVNPIVMGLLFYICFVPVGLVNRMRRKDPLHLRIIPSASTYWISREPSGSPPENMTHQY